MIRKKQSEFSEVHWNWVPREANSAAASLADREVGLQCWVDRPPPSLLRVLTADGLPGPPTQGKQTSTERTSRLKGSEKSQPQEVDREVVGAEAEH